MRRWLSGMGLVLLLLLSLWACTSPKASPQAPTPTATPWPTATPFTATPAITPAVTATLSPWKALRLAAVPAFYGNADAQRLKTWLSWLFRVYDGQAEVYPGQWPQELPPLPKGARVLATVRARHWAFERVEVYLTLPESALQTWPQAWAAQGWVEGHLPLGMEPGPSGGGFVPKAMPGTVPTVFLCQEKGRPYPEADITLVHAPEEPGTIWALISVTRRGSEPGMTPCDSSMPRPPMSTLPVMHLPPGAQALKGGGGSSSGLAEKQHVLFRSTRSLSEVWKYLTQQVKDQGWTLVYQKDSPEVAWSIWRRTGEAGKPLTLYLALNRFREHTYAAVAAALKAPWSALPEVASKFRPGKVTWHGPEPEAALLRTLAYMLGVFRPMGETYYLGEAVGAWKDWDWDGLHVLATVFENEGPLPRPHTVLYAYAEQPLDTLVSYLEQQAQRRGWQRITLEEAPALLWELPERGGETMLHFCPASEGQPGHIWFLLQPWGQGWFLEAREDTTTCQKEALSAPEPFVEGDILRALRGHLHFPLPAGTLRLIDENYNPDLILSSVFVEATWNELQAWLRDMEAALKARGWYLTQSSDTAERGYQHLQAQMEANNTRYTLNLLLLPFPEGQWLVLLHIYA